MHEMIDSMKQKGGACFSSAKVRKDYQKMDTKTVLICSLKIYDLKS